MTRWSFSKVMKRIVFSWQGLLALMLPTILPSVGCVATDLAANPPSLDEAYEWLSQVPRAVVSVHGAVSRTISLPAIIMFVKFSKLEVPKIRLPTELLTLPSLEMPLVSAFSRPSIQMPPVPSIALPSIRFPTIPAIKNISVCPVGVWSFMQIPDLSNIAWRPQSIPTFPAVALYSLSESLYEQAVTGLAFLLAGAFVALALNSVYAFWYLDLGGNYPTSPEKEERSPVLEEYLCSAWNIAKYFILEYDIFGNECPPYRENTQASQNWKKKSTMTGPSFVVGSGPSVVFQPNSSLATVAPIDFPSSIDPPPTIAGRTDEINQSFVRYPFYSRTEELTSPKVFGAPIPLSTRVSTLNHKWAPFCARPHDTACCAIKSMNAVPLKVSPQSIPATAPRMEVDHEIKKRLFADAFEQKCRDTCIEKWKLETHQEMHYGASNGCTVIALMISLGYVNQSLGRIRRYLDSRAITHVIASACIPVLRDIRGEGSSDFLEFDEGITKLEEELIYHEENFQDLQNGSLFDEERLDELVASIANPNFPELGMAILFQQHAIAVLKHAEGSFEVVDSLKRGGDDHAYRYWCHDADSLRTLLQHFAYRNVDAATIRLPIDYNSAHIHGDPRVFTARIFKPRPAPTIIHPASSADSPRSQNACVGMIHANTDASSGGALVHDWQKEQEQSDFLLALSLARDELEQQHAYFQMESNSFGSLALAA